MSTGGPTPKAVHGHGEPAPPASARLRRVLIAVIRLLPGQQGDAVMLLAAGCSPDDAFAKLLEELEGAVLPTEIDREDLVAAAVRPASGGQFHVVSSDAELEAPSGRPVLFSLSSRTDTNSHRA